MMVKDKKPEKGVSKLTYRCSCNESRNSPMFCSYNIDEISYELTNSVIKSLFIQRSQEITDYFREISNILKKSNEAEDCLIYLKNDAGTHFLLASEEDENNTSTIHESNEQLEGFDCFLPGKIKSSGFIQDSIHLPRE